MPSGLPHYQRRHDNAGGECKCSYCGTVRDNKFENCRNCGANEYVEAKTDFNNTGSSGVISGRQAVSPTPQVHRFSGIVRNDIARLYE